MIIDKSKTYRTKEGCEVRIYSTDGIHPYVVHGAIKNSNGWSLESWCGDGSYNPNYAKTGVMDLVEADPHGILPRHRELLAGVYEEMDYKNAAFGLRDAALPVTEMRCDFQAALIALARLDGERGE